MLNSLVSELVGPNGLLNGKIVSSYRSIISQSQQETLEILLGNNQKLFGKVLNQQNLSRLAFEYEGLKTLKEFSNEEYISIPKPIGLQKLNNNKAILIIDWIDIDQGDQQKLGKGLALLHKDSQANNPGKFGWETDGYIGFNFQKKGWCENWGEFFVRFRLIPQIEMANKIGIRISDYTDMFPELSKLLNQHNPEPSLVHGDLWSGNVSILKDGKGAIFDPAVYWGDREVDIAMSFLFGGFSSSFYKSYFKEYEFPSSWKKRIEIYNLYHILNHANIFRGGYIKQSMDLLKKIKTEIL